MHARQRRSSLTRNSLPLLPFIFFVGHAVPSTSFAFSISSQIFEFNVAMQSRLEILLLWLLLGGLLDPVWSLPYPAGSSPHNSPVAHSHLAGHTDSTAKPNKPQRPKTQGIEWSSRLGLPNPQRYVPSAEERDLTVPQIDVGNKFLDGRYDSTFIDIGPLNADAALFRVMQSPTVSLAAKKEFATWVLWLLFPETTMYGRARTTMEVGRVRYIFGGRTWEKRKNTVKAARFHSEVDEAMDMFSIPIEAPEPGLCTLGTNLFPGRLLASRHTGRHCPTMRGTICPLLIPSTQI